MSRLMIVVEFEVKPEHHSAFVELMKNHARLSRAEDGCQQFDVLSPQNDQNRVLLVEAWRDQAAPRRARETAADGAKSGNLRTLARQPEGYTLYRRLTADHRETPGGGPAPRATEGLPK